MQPLSIVTHVRLSFEQSDSGIAYMNHDIAHYESESIYNLADR